MTQPSIGFTVSHEVRAPSQVVWSVLGDFGSEHRWTKTLVHCARDTEQVGIGTKRTCKLPKPLMGRTEVRETLSEFEPGVALAYELDGPAGPFARAKSRWSTRATSEDMTLVSVRGEFTPHNWLGRCVLWPMAKPMLCRLTREVLQELDGYLQARGGERVCIPTD